MNKWLNRVRTELLEIYGESYLRFLKAEIVGFASYPLLILLLFLSTQPYIIRTVSSWGVSHWGMVGIFYIVFAMLPYIKKRYEVKLNQEMEQKYKQTVYYRWISRGIRVVLGTLMLLIGFMLIQWLQQPQPISQAVTEYGYPVYLPTQLPFRPTKQYAEITTNPFTYRIDVFYENGDTQLNLYISKDDEDLHLANAVLKNGTKADYEEFDDISDEGKRYYYYELTWYQKGFSYRLTYCLSENQPQPNKEVLLNIANSFKPVHP